MSIQDKKITDAAVAAAGVQSQPDKLTGTAAQNKRVFDNLVTAVVKTALNGLIDELTGSNAAAQLGIQTIPGFSAADIQTALEQIVKAMQDVTQGSVTDGSITLAKLAADVTAAALGGAAASHTHGAADVNSGVLDIARIPALTGDKLPDGIVTNGKIGAAAVTSEKLAALAVLAAHIAQGAVTGQKIANKTITWDNLSDIARYGNVATIGATGITNLSPDWGGAIITSWLSGVEIHFNPSIVTSLPLGWNCRIYSILNPLTLSWDGTENVYDVARGIFFGNAAGSIAVPKNRYVEMQKLTGNAFAISGSFADRYITSGTGEPSGGNDGDIYIQYTE